MKTLNIGNRVYCVVDGLSRYAERFRINNDKGRWRGLWFENGTDKSYPISKRELPTGNWQIIAQWRYIKGLPEYTELTKHSINETDLLLIKI